MLRLSIYIPLWFYSNDTETTTVFKYPKFTFHYGSILIEPPKNIYSNPVLFTFHYGSILISISRITECFFIIFTFHYGSILIRILYNKFRASENLHSTMVLF